MAKRVATTTFAGSVAVAVNPSANSPSTPLSQRVRRRFVIAPSVCVAIHAAMRPYGRHTRGGRVARSTAAGAATRSATTGAARAARRTTSAAPSACAASAATATKPTSATTSTKVHRNVRHSPPIYLKVCRNLRWTFQSTQPVSTTNH